MRNTISPNHEPFVNWVRTYHVLSLEEDVFFCDSENCVKEVTIISKGNDKNNEHFLDFTEMANQDLQLTYSVCKPCTSVRRFSNKDRKKSCFSISTISHYQSLDIFTQKQRLKIFTPFDKTVHHNFYVKSIVAKLECKKTTNSNSFVGFEFGISDLGNFYAQIKF